MVLDPLPIEDRNICPVCGIALKFGVTTIFNKQQNAEVCTNCNAVLGK